MTEPATSVLETIANIMSPSEKEGVCPSKFGLEANSGGDSKIPVTGQRGDKGGAGGRASEFNYLLGLLLATPQE